MKVRLKNGRVVRLVGWEFSHDTMFLLCEMLNRVPNSLICCTDEGDTGIRAVLVREIVADVPRTEVLNGKTMGGTST